MAVYHRTKVNGIEVPSKPHLINLAGGRLARRKAFPPIIRGQDRCPAVGRRVVATQSLCGEIEWLTPNADPTAAPNTHPLTGVVRTVARMRADITPGHFLRLSVACVPSGQTQTGGAGGVAGGVQGSVRVQVVWYAQGASTATTTRVRTLPVSSLADGYSPNVPWGAVRLRTFDLVAPPNLFDNPDLADWTGHVGALITISHIGGARVIDCCLSEIPQQFVRESDDAADLWTYHVGAWPNPAGNLQDMSKAWQRWSETSPDGRPQGGSWHMLDVAASQELRLGPHILNWTSYSESGSSPADTDVHAGNPVTTTSSSFVRLWDGDAGGYSTTAPGWCISSAAYARDASECDAYWAGDQGTATAGSIPVIVAVYGGGDAGSAGTVRVQSAAHSWVDCPVATGAGGWNYAYGHLECGIGPGDDRIVQAFMRRDSGGSTLQISALSVFRAGQYTPTI